MRLVLLVALALTTAACPLVDDDDGGDGSSWVAVGDLPVAYKDAYCTYLARCGFFPDKTTCTHAALAIIPTIDPNLVAAVQAGRVRYNGSYVRACYDAVANDTCDTTDENGRARIPACGAFFEGTIASGGECFLDQECISQDCVGGDTGTSCTLGVCVGDAPPSRSPTPVGLPCTSNQSCVDGAYCDTGTSLCTPLKAANELCSTSDECGYGLGCAGVTGERVCQPLPGPGEACRADLPCRDEGQYCDGTICAQIGLQGAPCTSSLQCSPYYRCDFNTGMCAKAPALGEPCSPGARCFDADTYCDSATLTCQPAKADGEPCSNDLECESVLCDFTGVAPVCASPTTCFQ